MREKKCARRIQYVQSNMELNNRFFDGAGIIATIRMFEMSRSVIANGQKVIVLFDR